MSKVLLPLPKDKGKVKKYIIRRLDKRTGIRQTIVIYGKDGILHTVTKGDNENENTV